MRVKLNDEDYITDADADALESKSINYLETILNSTLLITPEILVKTYKASNICNKIDQFKLILERALEQNIDLNAQEYGSFNSTFLGYVCANPKIELIQFLLEKGANPNIEDKYGVTPLHIIISYHSFNQNNFNIAKLLIQKGSNIEFKNLSGLPPIFYAVRLY